MKAQQLRHGGNLISELKARDICVDRLNEWLDLSTGISPFSYPVPQLSDRVWRDLPQIDDGFKKSVEGYYGSDNFVTTAGSQAIIKLLPELIILKNTKYRVFVPKVGYKEHLKSWQSQEVEIKQYQELPSLESLLPNDVLVVINPNNPSGEFISKERLLEYANKLESLGGYLIVDEAFIDVHKNTDSVIDKNTPDSLIVFRSIGKFFGLAGLRIGFVFAPPRVLERIAIEQGPWTVNGPALEIVKIALKDRAWQSKQLERIRLASSRLNLLIDEYFPNSQRAGCELFTTLYLENAKDMFELLFEHKVYVRLCDEEDSVRLGLPDEEGLEKLGSVFKAIFEGRNKYE